MITVRKSEDRGGGNFDWLKTSHSFSFGDYHDPNQMGYRTLRVINEDFIAPGRGFGAHPHRDMEIVTYVLQGALQHKDSMGNESVLQPGEFQRMSAGSGVTHSEFSGSADKATHLLQIWIHPEVRGLPPTYEELRPAREKGLQLIASRDAEQGSMKIHQDVKLFRGIMDPDQSLTYELGEGRGAWLQLISGDLELNGEWLEAGDGAHIEAEAINAKSISGAEYLLFDLK